MNRIRGHLTYANVLSTLCLVLLLGGGSAYAASQLGKESVGAKQLKNEAVTPAKLSTAAKATLIGAAGPKGATGVTGETGAQGSKGEPGTPGAQGTPGVPGTPGADGTARAYARVSLSGVIANSKNVTSIEAAGSSLFCIHLPFTPDSVIATGEVYAADQPASSAGAFVLATAGLGKGETACPAGTSAYVSTSAGGVREHLPFFVMFN